LGDIVEPVGDLSVVFNFDVNECVEVVDAFGLADVLFNHLDVVRACSHLLGVHVVVDLHGDLGRSELESLELGGCLGFEPVPLDKLRHFGLLLIDLLHVADIECLDHEFAVVVVTADLHVHAVLVSVIVPGVPDVDVGFAFTQVRQLELELVVV